MITFSLNCISVFLTCRAWRTRIDTKVTTGIYVTLGDTGNSVYFVWMKFPSVTLVFDRSKYSNLNKVLLNIRWLYFSLRSGIGNREPCSEWLRGKSNMWVTPYGIPHITEVRARRVWFCSYVSERSSISGFYVRCILIAPSCANRMLLTHQYHIVICSY